MAPEAGESHLLRHEALTRRSRYQVCENRILANFSDFLDRGKELFNRPETLGISVSTVETEIPSFPRPSEKKVFVGSAAAQIKLFAWPGCGARLVDQQPAEQPRRE